MRVCAPSSYSDNLCAIALAFLQWERCCCARGATCHNVNKSVTTSMAMMRDSKSVIMVLLHARVLQRQIVCKRNAGFQHMISVWRRTALYRPWLHSLARHHPSGEHSVTNPGFNWNGCKPSFVPSHSLVTGIPIVIESVLALH